MKILEQEGYDLMGAAFDVYNIMGHGFLEEVYQECLERSLEDNGVPFESQPLLRLRFKHHTLTKTYRPDLIVYDQIIVELKAKQSLINGDTAQVINYLKATGKRVGYLLNFGKEKSLEWKRIVL